MTVPEQETPQQEEESPVYHISLERLEQLKRSVVALLAARLPPSSPSRQKTDQNQAGIRALFNEIADYASQEQGFIQTGMPIQEIVFRTLLTRRNSPTNLRDLHYELTERWATPIRPINITENSLARILDADTFYGFARVTSGEESS